VIERVQVHKKTDELEAIDGLLEDESLTPDKRAALLDRRRQVEGFPGEHFEVVTRIGPIPELIGRVRSPPTQEAQGGLEETVTHLEREIDLARAAGDDAAVEDFRGVLARIREGGLVTPSGKPRKLATKVVEIRAHLVGEA
jgi:hypothetical protein